MLKHRKIITPGSSAWYRALMAGFCLLYGFSAGAQNDPQAGGRTFQMFCAGCHGPDGFATYEHAPSFSMGEHLQKDDRELLQSVLNGTGNMPPWRDMLSVQDLRNAIAYIRMMHERKLKGQPPLQVEKGGRQYLFKPVGEQDMDWKASGDK
jgi:mono/diheme cytochrome c family protein